MTLDDMINDAGSALRHQPVGSPPPIERLVQRRRRRRLVPAGIAGIAAVAALALATTGSIARTNRVVSASPPTTNRVVSPPTLPLTAASTTPPTPPTTTLAPTSRVPLLALGKEASRAAIPWSQVGAGWFVAEWAATPGLGAGQNLPAGAIPADKAPITLYLVNPIGGRYAVKSFPPGASAPGDVVDWSGDGRRALLTKPVDSGTAVTEVDLASGATHGFLVSGYASVSYTRPSGRAILVMHSSQPLSLERVNLNGGHQLTFPVDLPGVGKLRDGFLPTPDGTQLVVQAERGLALLSNNGQFIRQLSGGTASRYCQPVRWWNADQVLASCSDITGAGTNQVWVVPLSGAAATALTGPPRRPGPDNGDVNAWKLGGSTYVQALGGCGFQYLAQLNSDKTTTPVAAPGVDSSESVFLLGTDGTRLAARATVGCGGGISLLWYDPVANTTSVVLGPPVNGGGVLSAVLFPTPTR